MKKTFRIYLGVIFTDIILLLVLSLYFIFFNSIPRNIFFDLLMVLLTLWVIYLFLKHISFKLEIINNEAIKESYFFGKERQLKISSIKKIYRGYYSLFTYAREKNGNFILKSLLLILSRGALNPFGGMAMVSFNENFPSMPVGGGIVGVIYNLNPNIEISKELNDFIPAGVRKKIGIKLTVADIVGLWIWRALLFILALIILIFVLVALAAIIGVIFKK